MEPKEKIITFKASQKYLRLIKNLETALKLDRSKTIRLALDEAVEKYVSKGFRGDFFVMDTQSFHATLMAYAEKMKRLEVLEKEVSDLKALLERNHPEAFESWKHQKRWKEIERTQGKGAAEQYRKDDILK